MNLASCTASYLHWKEKKYGEEGGAKETNDIRDDGKNRRKKKGRGKNKD
jgi:hypothetical protein